MWLVRYIPVRDEIFLHALSALELPALGGPVDPVRGRLLRAGHELRHRLPRAARSSSCKSRDGPANISQIREDANALGYGSVEVQQFGTPRDVSLRVQLQEARDGLTEEEVQQQVVTDLRAAFEDTYEFRRVEVVGPRVSGELVQSGTLGVVFAIFGVLV